MVLSDLRRMQRAWSGRLLVIAVATAFLSVASISNACALTADTAPPTTHCDDCPDRDPGDCSSIALCVFAGTALMKSDVAFVPAVVTTSERIDSEPALSRSIFLIPPDPPPISG
jgi:hypothetical protein